MTQPYMGKAYVFATPCLINIMGVFKSYYPCGKVICCWYPCLYQATIHILVA
jgi:hypothetical protein